MTCALATCPAACTPASVRPAPATATGPPSIRDRRVFEQPLDGRPPRLPLPADEIGAVVGQKQLDRSHEASGCRREFGLAPGGTPRRRVSARQAVREPGFTTGRPSAQSGHAAGSHVGRSTASSAANGTSRLAWPPLRSTSDAAPTTSRAGRAGDLHRLARRQPRRDDVLDDEHALAGREVEPAPQQRAGRPAARRTSRGRRAPARPRGR